MARLRDGANPTGGKPVKRTIFYLRNYFRSDLNARRAACPGARKGPGTGRPTGGKPVSTTLFLHLRNYFFFERPKEL